MGFKIITRNLYFLLSIFVLYYNTGCKGQYWKTASLFNNYMHGIDSTSTSFFDNTHKIKLEEWFKKGRLIKTLSFNEEGNLITGTEYGNIKGYHFVQIYSYYESGFLSQYISADENSKIGTEKKYFENGNIEWIRNYKITLSGDTAKRKKNTYFSDDLYLNGIRFTYNDSNSSCILEKSILQKEYFENGVVKVNILFNKRIKRMELRSYYSNGNVLSIEPIRYGFLSREEFNAVFDRFIVCGVSKKYILDNLLYEDKINCWFIDGEAIYFTTDKKIEKRTSYIRGIVVD